MLGLRRKTSLTILALFVCVSRVSPRFVSQPTNYTVLEGEEVILECTVEGLDESDIIMWQANQSGQPRTVAIDGRISDNKQFRYSVVVDRTKGHHHLVIKEATLEDEGSFRCELFGSNSLSQQHHLTVNIPATVSVSPPGFLAVTVGDPVLLTCTADGKPKPKVTWSKTGADLSFHGDVFKIEQATVEDAGEYLCVADNGVGMSPATAFMEVLVQYSPSVQVEENMIYAEVGRTSRVRIVCQFDAVPPVEVIWRHNQSRINFKERTRLTESHTYNGHYVMEIAGLQEEDLGEYECVGGNSQGQAVGTVTVRAEPHDLEIRSDWDGPYCDQYQLDWAVSSHNPLVEFDLKLQEVNETHNVSWLSNTIPAPRHHDHLHTQHYVINDLKPSTQYRIKLRARNTYGYSDWIEFEFNTNEAGFTAPPHSATSASPPLTNPHQQTLYEGQNELGGGYTVVISPYVGDAESGANRGRSVSLSLLILVVMTAAAQLL